MSGLVIAIVGAESTGKTALAHALAQRLAADTGLRCSAIGEVLRDWCDRHGRTPRADEQAAIAHEQARRIAQARQAADIVIADTTPLMTAVYSALLFADHSLHAFALDQQAACAITLLTALDLPWVADGLQRDGPHVRVPVDTAVRQALLSAGLGWSVVAGGGDSRLDAALDAVTPLLLQRQTPRQGLLTRLQQSDAKQPQWRWICEKCDEPGCEHAALAALKR
jgi:nicotinamide riboside kinase